MSNQNKEEVKKNNQEEKKKKPTYWQRVIHGKGTVAEPWPTAEELWADPKVQKSLRKHNEFVRKREMDQENISNKSTESN